MSTQIQSEHFTNALYTLLDEAFDSVHGIFLDKGMSISGSNQVQEQNQ